MSKKVRIGNSSGFWGDEPRAMKRQIEKGNLDYLVADYLAEVSMSILHKQMQKRLDLGYVPDFIEHVKIAGKSLKVSFPKIITNAGGKNVLGCAQALQEVLLELGFTKRIFIITGDDLVTNLSEYAHKNEFSNLENNVPYAMIRDSVVVANAYTSSEGIVKALAAGADIVITGRASDSALTIGPLIHEFNWAANDWDKIASAMLAGHVLECGAQASGGNFTDWEKVEHWNDMGYPIVEVHSNGSFEVTKARHTGGLINKWTVKEQLIYEVGNPRYYIGPDVVVDLSTMSVADAEANKVRIDGVCGRPAPDTWKVSMAYFDGYRATGTVVVGGENVKEKCKRIIDIFWRRFDFKFEKIATNMIGANSLGEALASETREVLLQFVAFDPDRSKLEIFSKEIAGLILSGPQGMAASGGRPKIQEVIAYWPTLVNKVDLSLVISEVLPKGEKRLLSSFTPRIFEEKLELIEEFVDDSQPEYDILQAQSGWEKTSMKSLCLARSGDKGDGANIGLLARNEVVYNFFRDNLTPEVIKRWLNDLCEGEVIRYALPNILAFNFVITQVLDGGGTRSGRVDPQGKMLASSLLAQSVHVPKSLIKSLKK